MAGPALLGPFQHASRRAAVECHAQPELGHLDPMPGGVRAQICRSQAGPVLVHDAQRGAGGDRRAAAVAADPSLQRLGVPALGALQRRAPAALPGRLLELRAGSAGPAPLDGKLASQEPGFEGGKRPASAGQVVGGVLQGPDADAGPRHQAADRQPAVPCSTVKRASVAQRGRPWRPNSRTAVRACCSPRLACPSRMATCASSSARLGQADVAALLLEFQDGLLGRLHGLGQQAHRQQQLAPVGEQLANGRRARGGAARPGRGSAARPARHRAGR